MGAAAQVGLATESQCAAYPGGALPGRDYRSLRITLPGGGGMAFELPQSVELSCGLRLQPFAKAP